MTKNSSNKYLKDSGFARSIPKEWLRDPLMGKAAPKEWLKDPVTYRSPLNKEGIEIEDKEEIIKGEEIIKPEEPSVFQDIPFDPQRKIDKAWLGEIIGFSKVRVLATTSQEMTTGDHVKVTFSNEIYDTESEFDSTANRFTAKKVGYYLITCQLLLDRSVDDKYFKLVIYKNGAQEAQSTYRTTGTGAQGINITDILSLATGDYIEIYFYQNTGASIYTDSMTGANGDSCYLAIHKLS